jgi:hypothetical protein
VQSFCDLAPAGDVLWSGHLLLIPIAHQNPGWHAVQFGPEKPFLHRQSQLPDTYVA